MLIGQPGKNSYKSIIGLAGCGMRVKMGTGCGMSEILIAG